MKARIGALIIIIVGILVGFFVYSTEKAPDSKYAFKLGLDLAGGTLLTYRADVSGLASGDVDDAMNSLREVIERRVNVFGVSEPLVQTERASIAGGKEERLIVELPGVTDVDAAVKALGETPILEFKLQDPIVAGATTTTYTATGLTGRYLKNASLQFGAADPSSLIQEAIVSLEFDEEGTALFADITTEHVGEILAIFLDGQIISDPVIQSTITDGKAIITGNGDVQMARDLVRNLNFGALPVPVQLVGAESIGASLGATVVNAGVMAGVWGLIIIALFMILWYRLPGVIATLGLALYALIILALFKVIPVTLTASGIAGFILTIGMAVDANILIFERMKEEIRSGKRIADAITEGFSRAWFSIRDGNLTAIFTAIILFYTTTSLIRGFALTLILGVVVSMLTAIGVTRTLLMAIAPKETTPMMRFLFGSGLSK
jgi:protein-export membrane protein SecD